jgi:hypothetical protein
MVNSHTLRVKEEMRLSYLLKTIKIDIHIFNLSVFLMMSVGLEFQDILQHHQMDRVCL